MHTEIIDEIINLILDSPITQKERELLIRYKDKLLTEPKKQEYHLAGLSEEIRQLAVDNLTKNRSLSPNFAAFSKKIATDGEFQRQLARGLISSAVIW